MDEIEKELKQITKDVFDCIIDDLDKQLKNPRKKMICGLKKHIVAMKTWGTNRGEYTDKGEWISCGTVGCLWGTAYYKVFGYLATGGPSWEWRDKSHWHKQMNQLFYMENLNNEELVIIYRAMNARGFLNENKLKGLDDSIRSKAIHALG